MQEKWKGQDKLLGSTDLMGWGFNQNHYQQNRAENGGLPDYHIYTSALANSLISKDELLSEPFFRRPTAGQPGAQLFTSTVDASAVNRVRDELLALAFPSLTLVTGGEKGGDVVARGFILEGRQINMNDSSMKNSWPISRENRDWLHSDIKEVAYSFGLKVFEAIVNNGGLK